MNPRIIDNRSARRLFLQRQGLSDSPYRKIGDPDLLALIERLGFVQVDSIQTVERAHHMILFARNQTYRHKQLSRLIEKEAELFENWTHDASIIPSRFFPYWKRRFAVRGEMLRERWGKTRRGDFESEVKNVLHHIRDNGPALARDLGNGDPKTPKGSSGWWDWHPSKTALEYLWHSGQLAVAARSGFQKVYDLTERVIAAEHRDAEPTSEEIIDWACRAALDRLGIATSGEIAAFWDLVTAEEAKTWCQARKDDALEEVLVKGAGDERPRAAFCWADNDPMHDLPEAPKRIRVLSPFDPLIRDRNRTQRLFGFHYRIEVFVPAAKRQFGYYVFPLLEGERLIGRIDMKHERDSGALRVKGLWLEPKIKLSAARLDRLEAELERQRRFTGAERVVFEDDYLKSAT
ncbi:winged helix-turn-helix domain-containing protein [Pelagibius litoralis]|uniref:Winged helix-turn-helix domain-containing protein n=1 Tax=Pelagibius litoralis TaxID=374515 RepID=A0A967C9F0_9PROT|nr:winged helix-turn-helix domain-containing protein [Pelagibius litoralis]NIA69052.1 winged helix-turn-helix domain-containing protein [Pelagibius litoralis]